MKIKILKLAVKYYNRILRKKRVQDGIPFDYDKLIWLFKYRFDKLDGDGLADVYNEISKRCKIVCIANSSDITKCKWQRLNRELIP